VSATLTRPAPEETAQRARAILDDWLADPEMGAVLDGCTKYNSDWDDFYGGPLIPEYSVQRDAAHLIHGTIRVMALKSAVYELTGDEVAAELPVPVPLDVTSHALCAQFTALSRIQERTGHPFVHSTVNEHLLNTPYRSGDYTQQAYETAFGPIDSRYWIDADEAERRRVILDGLYAGIGITERGMTSAIGFAEAQA
jgi:hypothetical protein